MLQFRKLARNLLELRILPRRRAVVIEQSEKGLFFASPVGVEGPRKKRLSIVDQGQIGPHANDAFRAAVIPSPSACEFVEPQRSGKISFDEKRAK